MDAGGLGKSFDKWEAGLVANEAIYHHLWYHDNHISSFQTAR